MAYEYIPQIFYTVSFEEVEKLKEESLSDPAVWVLLQRNARFITSVPPKYREEEELALIGLFKSNGQTYNYLSEDIKKKHGLLAFKLSHQNIRYINTLSYKDCLLVIDNLAKSHKKIMPSLDYPDISSLEEQVAYALLPSTMLCAEQQVVNPLDIMKKIIDIQPRIKEDREAFDIVNTIPYLADIFSPTLYEDADFIKPYVKRHPAIIRFNKKLKADENFFQELLDSSLKSSPFVQLSFFADNIINNKKFIIDFFNTSENYIYSYEYLSEELKKDEEVLLAVLNNAKFTEQEIDVSLCHVLDNMPLPLLNTIMGEPSGNESRYSALMRENREIVKRMKDYRLLLAEKDKLNKAIQDNSDTKFRVNKL